MTLTERFNEAQKVMANEIVRGEHESTPANVNGQDMKTPLAITSGEEAGSSGGGSAAAAATVKPAPAKATASLAKPKIAAAARGGATVSRVARGAGATASVRGGARPAVRGGAAASAKVASPSHKSSSNKSAAKQ